MDTGQVGWSKREEFIEREIKEDSNYWFHIFDYMLLAYLYLNLKSIFSIHKRDTTIEQH